MCTTQPEQQSDRFLFSLECLKIERPINCRLDTRYTLVCLASLWISTESHNTDLFKYALISSARVLLDTTGNI